jgi:fumarate reductase flavoprotein subunit
VGSGRRVFGVEVQSGRRSTTVLAHSVLLCDGGFQANPEMVHRHITSTYRLRAADTGTGDGIRMGVAVGAALWNMEWFYGHCLARDAMWDNDLWPMLSLYQVIEHALVVDSDGRRFADEGVSNQHMAIAIAKSVEPGKTWVVCDDAVWQGAARGGPLPVNPLLLEHHATVRVADNLVALARQMAVPTGALQRTVAEFNEFARSRVPLTPPRSGHAVPLDRPPYYALPLVVGITFTMGGLLVDRDARVLDAGMRPIPGLYAAGGTMGGLQGGPTPAYAGGWSEAATFGLLAADHSIGQVT